jgi:hypothetical protein
VTISDDPSSTISSAAVLALLASSVGDPEGTRTITSIVLLLIVLGIALVMLAFWLFRLTRPDKELLAPLEVMGERKWRRADPVWQRRRLDEVRPADAQPLQPSAAPPQFDEAFFEYRPAAAGFEDLHDAAHTNGGQSSHDVEPAAPEAPVDSDKSPDAPVPAAVANVVVAPPGDDSLDAEPAAEPAQPAPPIKPISPTPVGIERPDLPERDIDPDVMAAAIAELDAELRLGRERRPETPD